MSEKEINAAKTVEWIIILSAWEPPLFVPRYDFRG
jgi:hypothetical protein